MAELTNACCFKPPSGSHCYSGRRKFTYLHLPRKDGQAGVVTRGQIRQPRSRPWGLGACFSHGHQANYLRVLGTRLERERGCRQLCKQQAGDVSAVMHMATRGQPPTYS